MEVAREDCNVLDIYSLPAILTSNYSRNVLCYFEVSLYCTGLIKPSPVNRMHIIEVASTRTIQISMHLSHGGAPVAHLSIFELSLHKLCT